VSTHLAGPILYILRYTNSHVIMPQISVKVQP
jgi:hypothetical protein